MPGILCEHCTGACCQYVALPIDTPKTKAEFDDVRWYLLHENMSVFIEDGDWYISFPTRCRHLLPDHRCGIYTTRPRICRTYSADGCDYHSGDYGWEAHFTCAEHLDEYIRDHLKTSNRSDRSDRYKSSDSKKQYKLQKRRARLPRAAGVPASAAASGGTPAPGGRALPVLRVAAGGYQP